MEALQSKVTLEEFISQVFSSMRPRLLRLIKAELERRMLELRDGVIGNRRYERGGELKRWGYTVRKYLTTPLGRLEGVRVPRIRGKTGEVRMFMDRFTHLCKDLVDQLILAQVFNMSGRKLSLWFELQSEDVITYPTLTRLTHRVKEEIEGIRDRPIQGCYSALVVDGIYGRFRGVGKGVILVALGITDRGEIHLLDWTGARSERTAEWMKLLLRLRSRGLEKVKLVVGDGTVGLPEAVRQTYGEIPLQICLWHLCQDLMRSVKDISYTDRQRLYHQFWEVFNSVDEDQCYRRYLEFLVKWGNRSYQVQRIFSRYEENLFHFYQFPAAWRHRLRTTNVAEGFFRHLRTFLNRYPGWVDERHVIQIVGLFLKGIKVYRERYTKRSHYGRYLVQTA